jgi:Uma2 family endonuclease
MAFVIDDAFLPATLTAPPMSDDEFAEFCAEHPDLFFEMTAEGELIVMPPTYSDTGAENFEIAGQLRVWARNDGRGVGCDSSTGFVLPNGARRSPDASWTLKSRIRQLNPASRSRFWHLCPDFVIELQSSSDRPRKLRDKMREYLANGAQLGWLIDPEHRSVTIYRKDAEPETRTDLDSISGEGPVAGFELDLALVWDPLGE